MVNMNTKVCPSCGGYLKHYDTVPRIVRRKGRHSIHIQIRRLRCVKCKKLHRELPNNVSPYKQYETEIMVGVLNGFITPETLGFEDYPCEKTMERWITQKMRSPCEAEDSLIWTLFTRFIFSIKAGYGTHRLCLY